MSNNTNNTEPTVSLTKERAELADRATQLRAFFEAADSMIQTTDLTSNTTKSWTVFNKDTLRSYLQSPYSSTSQTQLRNLAKFLYTLSFPLRRLIQYFAAVPDYSVYKILPNYSLIEDNDEEKLLQDFENTCLYLRAIGLDLNLFRLGIISWREDAAYFVPMEDEATGETYLMPLDGQYCKISGVGYNGLYRVAYDFSYFNGSTGAWYLNIYPKEFTQKYKKYQNDSSLRWQTLDEARAFKINIDTPDLVLSPLVSLFESTIDLIDLQSIMAVKDALDAYKILVMNIPLLDSTTPDDYALSLNVAKKFFNKMVEDLPPEVTAILSPMKVDEISFEKSATSDSNAITDAYRNFIEQAGVSQVMDASKLSGASAVNASIITDVLTATKALLPQVQAFVNERVQLKYPNAMVHVKFTNVTEFTKKDKIAQVKEAASSGLPVKMEWMSLMGYDPLEAMASDWLETKLGIAITKWINPVKTSYTQSGNSGTVGAPTKDDGDLTDEGANTKEQEKNKK